jgi:hypothetical protein
LELAWARYLASDYVEAERAYRVALARAPSSVDARVGLGWSLARAGRCEDANRELEAVASDARAREAIASCASRASSNSVSLSAAFNEALFPGHPLKTSAAGVLASGSAKFAGPWVLGAAYRYLHVATTSGNTVSIAPFDQHEGYAHAGYRSDRVGIVARLAMVRDGSGFTGTSWHAGFSAHVAIAGDLLLDATISAYDDRTIGRVAPAWTIPIVGALRIAPGFAVQRAGQDTLGTATLSLFVDLPSVSIWAGAKYGEEDRPAYLGALSIYDVTERVTWGAWGGLRLRSGPVALQLTYAFDELRRTDALSPQKSGSHAFSIGPVVTF